MRTRTHGVWPVTVVTVLTFAGCSTAAPPESTSTLPVSPASTSTGPSRQASAAGTPYQGYPDGVAALGHSAITGEGTQPSGNEAEWKANSWATGTNTRVNSVYLRLRQANPAIDGHVVNIGEGGANLAGLTEQAHQLVQIQPQPELVIIATLDNDITCPASDAELATYRAELKRLLDMLAEQMPSSRFFITAQGSTPRNDAAIYSPAERARFGGTDSCAFLDPQGHLVPAKLRRLEAALAGYKSQVVDVCTDANRCVTDQSGVGWRLRRSDLSDDLNHLNLSGQARWAEHQWRLLQANQLIPAS